MKPLPALLQWLALFWAGCLPWVAFPLTANGQKETLSPPAAALSPLPPPNVNTNPPPWDRWRCLPRLADDAPPYRRVDFFFSYNEATEQPRWVAYTLTPEMITGDAVRQNDFRPDPGVATGSADLNDYRKSGYDRGHLAPAADMRRNAASQSASFLLSNMSPQLPAFNRGIWKKAEQWVREQVVNGEEFVYVVTGPFFNPAAPPRRIGANQVGIPDGFFKAIVTEAPAAKGIAFFLPHQPSEAPLTDFLLSIDQLEEKIGLDLFCSLPDGVENRVEAQCAPEDWHFSGRSP